MRSIASSKISDGRFPSIHMGTESFSASFGIYLLTILDATMNVETLSIRLGIGLAAADNLIRLHRRVYETFWRARARGIISTVFG
jgi:hypothetical protein